MLMKPKKNDHMTNLVNFVIVVNIIFAIVILIIFCVKESIPDTLVDCWYTFFGVELAAMATIKVTKPFRVKGGGDETNENNEDVSISDGEG